MRLGPAGLLAVAFAVACGHSANDPALMASAGGSSSSGSSNSGVGGTPSISSSGTGAATSGGAGGTAGTGASPGGSGGTAGDGVSGTAGEGSGGSAAGAGGAQGGSSGSSGAGGTSGGDGGTSEGGEGGEGGLPDPGPDPCEGVPAWDPNETWHDYSVNEKRVVSGEVWRCQVPHACHTYPGGDTVYQGWIFVAECNDPSAGGSPACQCDSGECCDGCYLRGQNHFCGEVPRYGNCDNGYLELDYWNLFCNGDATVCNRWAVHTKDTTAFCDQGTVCQESGEMASCVPN